jgi:signal transduction histidine kinase
MVKRRHPPWHNWWWRTKLSILLVVLAMVPVVVVTVHSDWRTRRDLIAAAHTQNLQQALAVADGLDRHLQDILGHIELVSLAPSISGLLSSGGAEGQAVNRFLRRVAAGCGFDAVLITDTAGAVIAASQRTLLGRSITGVPYFERALGGRILIDDPRFDVDDRKVYVYLAAPVRRNDGGVAGVALGRLTLETLDRRIAAERWFAGPGEFGMLWDEQGIRLSGNGQRFEPVVSLPANLREALAAERRFGPETRALIDRPGRLPEMLERSKNLLKNRHAGATFRLEPEGQPIYAAVVPLRQKPWLYGVFSGEQSVLRPRREQTRWLFLVALFSGTAAIVVGFLATARLCNPLHQLSTAAHALARGEMTHRVRLDTEDELGKLGAAFDAMADAIGARDAQLRGHAEHLEQTVAAQAEALRSSEAELEVVLAREREACARAEEASRQKDEFLSVVSHELRTPLNAVLGWARLLATARLDTGTVERAIRIIERNALAQGEIIDDLLDVSRMITGRLRLERRAVEMERVIEAALGTFGPAASAKRIDLVHSVDPDAGSVQADPERLQQILTNLLSNAIKFTPEHGRVELAARRIGEAVELRVSDTGIGIRREVLPHVFERFHQADSTPTRRYGGLGLGLAIVRHLVELHGGIVHAESAGEGKGATFIVRLRGTAREA